MRVITYIDRQAIAQSFSAGDLAISGVEVANRNYVFRVILLVSGLVAGLLAFETGLRFYYYSQNKYYVWPPYLKFSFNPLPGVMPGVNGTSKFSINSAGIRGDEFGDDLRYRILTVGGSTTECLYLDNTEAWPQILQDKLNELKAVNKVWVGNIGKSGKNTRDHLIQLKYLLPQYPEIHSVIMLLGVNEFLFRLAKDSTYDHAFLDDPGLEERQIPHAFYLYPVKFDFFGINEHLSIRNTASWRFGRQIYYSFIQNKTGKIQDKAGHSYIVWRKYRRNASEIVNRLPDLTTSLEEYERNLKAIIKIAGSNSTRLLFITQPSIWRENLSEREKELLWGGVIGDFPYEISGRYYSVEALREGMEKYNDKLLDVCKRAGVECLDLAKRLPGDTTVFYDDCHFNENGSRLVAEIISDYLVSTEHFKN